MRRFLKILWRVVKWCFIVFVLFLASLLFREQKIPAQWIKSAVDAHAPTNIVFTCDSAAFGFRHGVRVRGIRVYDRARANPLEPVLAVEDVSVDFLLRRVRLVALRVPRLHDGYYLPGYAERNEPVRATLPRIPSFTLTLVRPDILGVAPERVRATVKCSPRRLDLTDYRLVWPDLDRQMYVSGSAYVDFDEQRVWGEARGDARQAHFRPMLVVLDIPSVLPYMDAFTGVTEPVPAVATWDVNLVNNDFRLHLELHPTLGRYNGVPMRRVDGEIGLNVYTRGTNLNYTTSIGPLVAVDPKGRQLQGKLVVRGTNDVVNLDFDCSSTLPLQSLLPIADCLNDGTLDCLICETPPEITFAGTLAPDVERQGENDLGGTIAFSRGRFFSMPLSDVSLAYRYLGDTISFTDVSARGRDGGLYTGKAEIRVPGLDADKATFSIAAECRNGTLAELSDALGGNFAGRHGAVEGAVELTGPISTNIYPRLNGRGRIRVTDDHLAQMRLFMGLTDYLAANVPGVAGLVNQSQATADFTLTNGVLASDNIYIEGDVFSIKAWGSYDIPADRLDFTARVQLLRNDSFFAKLVHPVTFPFTKLLLEFKVVGSVDDPKWEYISVLDRIL